MGASGLPAVVNRLLMLQVRLSANGKMSRIISRFPKAMDELHIRDVECLISISSPSRAYPNPSKQKVAVGFIPTRIKNEAEKIRACPFTHMCPMSL